MEYKVKSLIPLIESNYRNFSNSEKIIADFFIKNTEDTDLSAKTVANNLYVSEAALSRFAKKCGFKGYREFIYSYKTTLEKRNNSSDSKETIKVFDAYQELLNKSYNLIDNKKINNIVSMLDEAKRVFVCGKGSSGKAADEIALRLMRVGVDISSITDSDKMKMQVVLMDKNSLAIGISVSGGTKEVIYFLEEAKKRGSRTVLITAGSNDKFMSFCDEVLLIPYIKYLNYGILISPQFPILVMTDLIFAYYTDRDKSKTEVLHDSTIKALGDIKLLN